MPSVQIKDVPADVHATLRRRAAEAHQSLQEYLLTRLIKEAGRPSIDEVFDRARARSTTSVSVGDVLAALSVDRDRS